ncbi:methylamine utilization protein [Paraburkholderia sp. D15]|uniref:methylamine utilization protein n=1 Tax=Paraburkholderia sp. D15 TaxID=2880218 RepID=UPI002478DAC2|nr:methylamine utilization protein [Paraburkholderia sp. D15]WGS52520.1 methylamine utilization protein [Paraburkholderia sp. D15]
MTIQRSFRTGLRRLLLASTRFMLAVLAAHAVPAAAATLQVHVADAGGAPIQDAVIYATPMDGHLPSRAPLGAEIAQRNKTFVPLVSVIQTGAAVKLPNLDDIAHDVYSLSAPKRFELKLYRGVPAHPVVFDKPGLVVLGCNIHDMMVAYLLVVHTPYFAKTDANGNASLADLPADRYRVTAWHYRQSDANARPEQIVGTSGHAATTFTLKLNAE